MSTVRTIFKSVAVGDTFLDIISREVFVKTSETQARMATPGNDMADDFEPDDPVEVETKE